MPLTKTKKAKCESCGRVWSSRKPDAPKLKCPTCGKYMVEIFDEEMKEEVKDESKCDNDDGSCSGGLSVPSFSPPDLPDPGDRKDGEKEISPGWRKRLDASAVIQSLWIA